MRTFECRSPYIWTFNHCPLLLQVKMWWNVICLHRGTPSGAKWTLQQLKMKHKTYYKQVRHIFLTPIDLRLKPTSIWFSIIFDMTLSKYQLVPISTCSSSNPQQNALHHRRIMMMKIRWLQPQRRMQRGQHGMVGTHSTWGDNFYLQYSDMKIPHLSAKIAVLKPK